LDFGPPVAFAPPVFPGVDDFHGNPLLMFFLEHDVQEMSAQFGVAAAYFRTSDSGFPSIAPRSRMFTSD